MAYVAYLRKSRADLEAEARGEGETLARHERALIDLAQKQHLALTEVYREIVSGETIAARPVMQQLLAEVEANMWDGVLVVDVDRLARGDTSDQGLIQKTFYYSNTLIITPRKIYYPHNDSDQQYLEFGLFMSRFEYKTINRRIQAGRLASVKEGKFPANSAPYGWAREKLQHDKGWKLTPIPEESEIVKQVFAWFTDAHSPIRTTSIAKRLNAQCVPTRSGKAWSSASVSAILRNPTHCGYVVWGRRGSVKRMCGGEIIRTRPRAADYSKYKGLHDPLIDESVFDRAQHLLSLNHTHPIPGKYNVKNPLMGLVYCSICGQKMQRRPYNSTGRQSSLICPTVGCPTVATDVSIVEAEVILALRRLLDEYTASHEAANPDQQVAADIKAHTSTLRALHLQRDKLSAQQQRAFELVEQGVYSTATFLSRQQQLNNDMEALDNKITDTESKIATLNHEKEARSNIIPKMQHVIDSYALTESPSDKNELLTSVLDKIIYSKSTRLRSIVGSDLELTIYPKFLPPHFARPHV